MLKSTSQGLTVDFIQIWRQQIVKLIVQCSKHKNTCTTI